MTIEELKTYYQNLLISQYRNKPNARAVIGLLVNSVFGDGIALQLARCFDLDTAVGAQLDVIGRIVGVERNIKGLDLESVFVQLGKYTGTPAGRRFGRYSDATPDTGKMSRYFNNSIYTMTDLQMRYVIKLKIIQNCTIASTKYLTDALYRVFGAGIAITDNQDMTMTIDVTEDYAKIYVIADYLGIFPCPMGVGKTVNYV
jgi:hypothetical protein